MDLTQLLGVIDSTTPTEASTHDELAKDLEDFKRVNPEVSASEIADATKSSREETTTGFNILSRTAKLGETTAAAAAALSPAIKTAPAPAPAPANTPHDTALSAAPSAADAPVASGPVVTVEFPQGTSYTGTVDSEGRPHGAGTVHFRSGARYEGDLMHGRRHGTGTYTYASGVRYEGAWRADRRHGPGTLVFSSGAKFATTFRDGSPVAAAGRLTSPCGRHRRQLPSGAVVRDVPALACAGSLPALRSPGPLAPADCAAVCQRVRAVFEAANVAPFAHLMRSLQLRLQPQELLQVNQFIGSQADMALAGDSSPLPPGGLVYRVLSAEDDPSAGLSAAEPLSAEPLKWPAPLPSAATPASGRFQLLGCSPEWALYAVARLWAERRRVPRVAELRASRLVGRVHASPNPPAHLQLEGYIPPVAVTRVFRFTKLTPELRSVLALPVELQASLADDLPRWTAQLHAAFSAAQLADLLAQAAHCQLFCGGSPSLDTAAPPQPTQVPAT